MSEASHNARFDLRELLGRQGPLAERLPGFTERNEQLLMAGWVARAIAEQRSLIVEAGTGVGKTFAYLVPALLAGKRVIISTGTRSLQDQLFRRDLPSITAVLGRPVRVALLKGRANYLCDYRLAAAMSQAEARGLSRDLSMSLRKVKLWSMQTRKGDTSELAALAESDPIWPWVTSTRDNCLGAECSLFERCHVMAARREAQAADIVVVNHHLLMADLLLKEHGFGELLPGAEAVIVDEAHQLPEVASQVFATTLSARQLRELARDVVQQYRSAKLVGISQQQLEMMEALEQQAQLGGQALNGLAETQDASRWPDLLFDVLADAQLLLQNFAANCALQSEEQVELRNLRERALELAARCELLAAPATTADVAAAVRWSTMNKAGFVLHHAPVEVAQPLAALIKKQAGAWIFTSATLAVGTDLKHFAARIGMPDIDTQLLGSPFNYQRQALLYLPRGLDMPSSPQHTQQVLDAALPVIAASGGRAFLLFTSYRALREAAERLRALWGTAAPYPLLVQGEAPRDLLLKQFREYGNAVLLGTGSFWEGVDVKGHALCVVVIDKLPFAVPDEPLLKARLTMIDQRGGNPFMEEQVPQAVVSLKQGVGRLIRDQNDFGVIMLCDRRLTTRSYGSVFLNSLPPMPRTSDPVVVGEFLQRHMQDAQLSVAPMLAGVEF
ncbi:MAG: ATP-dependent DNA helicase [Steroidobacteraceae bacterium]